jgi:hypothetical protein
MDLIKMARDKIDQVKTDRVKMDRVKIDRVKVTKEEVKSKKVDPLILQKMKETVEKNYTNDVLLRLSSLFLYSFLLARHKDFEEALGAPQQISKRMKKAQLVEQVATVFSSRILFEQLMSVLPSDVTRALSILVWEGMKKVGELEKELKTEIFVRPQQEKGRMFYSYEHMKNVKGPFLFFCFRDRGYDFYYSYQDFSPDRYTIFLPDEIRKVLKTYLTPPEGYYLTPLDAIAKTDFIYKSEGEIFKELPLYYEYIRQGHMQLSKDGKPTKASLRHLKQSSAVREFYEGGSKDLELLKTNFMVAMVQIIMKEEKPKDPLGLLKQLFNSYSAQGGISWIMNNLLFHIKVKAGSSIYYLDGKRKLNASVLSLLKDLPTGQWISIENLLRFILLRDIDLAPVDISSASRFLYYSGQDRYDQKAFIDSAIYQDAVIAPLVKGSMFLFATFGLVDIAYDFPANKVLKQKGEQYLSIFDGIKYVQLTELGAYLSGRTSEYTRPIQEEKGAEVILDPNRLIITLHGEDRLKSMILERFANKISESRYKIDYSSFLKECSSKKDITQRIKLFKTEIVSKPPQVWLEFFDRVLSRVHPLTSQETLKVYKLSPDKELIHLMATDSILKKYILKADDFHIIVELSNFPKVRQRLESLGYLI